jgi:hypothetical protein
MDFTGKPMRTMVFIEPAGTASDTGLAGWVARSVTCAQSLPPTR